VGTRAYNQYCALAHALDIVGERWTLLIVRELLVGPRRFKDLLDGLPGISTNLLSNRLKGLEESGVLRRRTLPPPAASTVYELTPFGEALEEALIAIGRWGVRVLPPLEEDELLPGPGSTVLEIKSIFRPEAARGLEETYELHIGAEVIQVRVKDDAVEAQQGPIEHPDATIHTTDMKSYLALLTHQMSPEEALSKGLVRIEGDAGALGRFLDLFGLPRNPVEVDVHS
jgi:DNA-binding HxlR family transcriptional regulator